MSASDDASAIQARKGEHLELAATADVDLSTPVTWQDIQLVHEALPELDLDDVELAVPFLGRRLEAPLVIAGMTGGHPAAREINAALAAGAERHGLALGLGSQRAALLDPTLTPTYSIVRELAPTAFILGNVGVAQLLPQRSGPPLSMVQLKAAVDMVHADALAIHLNFLEESIQTEGDRRAAGALDAVAGAAAFLDVPVIPKETGAGMSRATALRLAEAGAAALDVGGSGGTSFAAVEALRAQARRDERGIRVGALLRDWGIPTPISVLAAGAAGLPIIATGGVRNGLDAAKAIALGATLVGVARPLLLAAREGPAAVSSWIEGFLDELRTVMFLCGARTPAELRRLRPIVRGATSDWVAQLGLEHELEARV